MKPTQSQVGSTALDQRDRLSFSIPISPSSNEVTEPAADTINGFGIPAHRLYSTAMSIFLTGLSGQAREATAGEKTSEHGDVVAG